MHVIQEVGSYAGLVAIPAVAVMSGLLFSQARDLKRLRRWAGRAPERAAAQATRSASPSVATPPREPERTAVRPAGFAPGAPAQRPPAATVAGAPPSVPNGGSAELGAAATLPGEHPEPVGEPFTGVPGTRHDYRGPRSRRLPIVAAAAALVVLVVVIVVTQVGGGGSARRPATHASASPPAPSNVNVAVLNATAVPGLGARFGSRVRRAGFHLADVGNAAQHDRAQSAVLYVPGQSAAAALVADKLGLAHEDQADAADRSRAAGAAVIVVLGADRAG